MSFKSHAVAAAATLALFAGSASALELAVNGGFESGSFAPGWSVFDSPPDNEATVVTPGYMSTFAGRLNSRSTGGTVIKQANLAPGLLAGSPIKITLWAKGERPFSDSFVEFFSEKAGPGTNKSEILSGLPGLKKDEWTYYEFNTTVASLAQGGAPGGVTLQLKASASAVQGSYSDVMFDNVSIQAIPEPSTYALMLAGLAGVGLLAKRRRQA